MSSLVVALQGGAAWACQGPGTGDSLDSRWDSGGESSTLCVPSDLNDDDLTFSSILNIASDRGLTRVEIDGNDPRWEPDPYDCGALPTGSEITIASATPGERVQIPGLKLYLSDLTLEDVEVTGACLLDAQGTGSFLGVGLYVKESTLTAHNLRLLGQDAGGEAQIAFYARDSALTLTDLELEGSPYPALWLEQKTHDTSLDLVGCSVLNNGGGGILAQRQLGHNSSFFTISLDDCTFSGNVAHNYLANDLYISSVDRFSLSSSELTGQASEPVDRCLDDFGASTLGCSQGVKLSNVPEATLRDVYIHDYQWPYGAGIIAFSDTGSSISLVAEDLRLERLTGTGEESYGGGAMLFYAVEADLSGVEAQDLAANEGALIWAEGYGLGWLKLDDTSLEGFQGSALWIHTLQSAEITHTQLCDGDTVEGRGVFLEVQETHTSVSNSLFHNARSSVSGSAALFASQSSSYTFTASNNTLSQGGGETGILVQGGRGHEVYNNIVVAAVTGISVNDKQSPAPFVDFNLFDEISGDAQLAYGAAEGDLGSSRLGDPLFWDSYVEGDCSTTPYLAYGSPAIDGGYPEDSDPLLNDPDGSRADIGAYGGPGSLLPDGDQDGEPLGQDCDDTQAGVYHGADEVPYDGLDNDCVGDTLDDDLDQDGYLLADDCDDAQTDVHPGAEEVPNDDIDQDCDGLDLVPDPAAPTISYTGDRLLCAGSTAPAQALLYSLGLLMLAARRRNL